MNANRTFCNDQVLDECGNRCGFTGSQGCDKLPGTFSAVELKSSGSRIQMSATVNGSLLLATVSSISVRVNDSANVTSADGAGRNASTNGTTVVTTDIITPFFSVSPVNVTTNRTAADISSSGGVVSFSSDAVFARDVVLGSAQRDGLITLLNAIVGEVPLTLDRFGNKSATVRFSLKSINNSTLIELPSEGGKILTTSNTNLITSLAGLTGDKPLVFQIAGSKSSTTLSFVPPSQSRTIQLPDQSGRVLLAEGLPAELSSGRLEGTFKFSNGAGSLSLSAAFAGTSENSLMYPAASGVLLSTGNLADITSEAGSVTSMRISNTLQVDGTLSAGRFSATVDDFSGGRNAFVDFDLVGTKGRLQFPRGFTDTVYTLPAQSGSLLSTGTLRDISIEAGAMSSLAVDGLAHLRSALTVGTNSSDIFYFSTDRRGSDSLVVQVKNGEAVAVTSLSFPSTGSHRLAFPAASGQLLSTGNLDDISTLNGVDVLLVSTVANLTGKVVLGSASTSVALVGGLRTDLSFVLEAPVNSTNTSNIYTTISPGVPSSNRRFELPSVNGTFVTTGNLGDITALANLTGPRPLTVRHPSNASSVLHFTPASPNSTLTYTLSNVSGTVLTDSTLLQTLAPAALRVANVSAGSLYSSSVVLNGTDKSGATTLDLGQFTRILGDLFLTSRDDLGKFLQLTVRNLTSPRKVEFGDFGGTIITSENIREYQKSELTASLSLDNLNLSSSAFIGLNSSTPLVVNGRLVGSGLWFSEDEAATLLRLSTPDLRGLTSALLQFLRSAARKLPVGVVDASGAEVESFLSPQPPLTISDATCAGLFAARGISTFPTLVEWLRGQGALVRGEGGWRVDLGPFDINSRHDVFPVLKCAALGFPSASASGVFDLTLPPERALLLSTANLDDITLSAGPVTSLGVREELRISGRLRVGPTDASANPPSSSIEFDAAIVSDLEFDGQSVGGAKTRMHIMDPFASTLVTLGDVSGTIVTSGNMPATVDAMAVNARSTFAGHTAVVGEATLGRRDSTDKISFGASVQAPIPLIFDGTSTGMSSLLLAVTDATEDNVLGLPDASGTLISSGNIPKVFDELTAVNVLQSKASSVLGGSVAIGSLGSPAKLSVTGKVKGATPLSFESHVSSGYAVSLGVEKPSIDRTLYLPDADGTLLTVDMLSTLTNITVVGDSKVIGHLSAEGRVTLGPSPSTKISIGGTLQGPFPLRFGGVGSSPHTLVLNVQEPTSDNIISLPDVSGTVITSGNLPTTLLSTEAFTVKAAALVVDVNGVFFGPGANDDGSGSFVFSDSSSSSAFRATAQNQFVARATGGVMFVTGLTPRGAPIGAVLEAGGSSWSILSDRNAKSHIRAVNDSEVLELLGGVEVMRWRYEGGAREHIGPMAQDFFSAFKLGDDPTRISSVDLDGVALASIRALKVAVDEERGRVKNLEERLEAQEARLLEQAALISELRRRMGV